MQICLLVIGEYNQLTAASEEVGCCFPKQNIRGKIFLYDVDSFQYLTILKVLIIELISSLFSHSH